MSQEFLDFLARQKPRPPKKFCTSGQKTDGDATVQPERFKSWSTWKDEFSGNLAIFCSDERFVTATLEFLRRHLDIDRCDLMVVAGGPVFIPQNETALMERLDLLLKAHKIKQVIIVAHDGCGYYKHRHKELTPQRLREKQRNDLQSALKALQAKGVQAKAFFAFVESGDIVFEGVGV